MNGSRRERSGKAHSKEGGSPQPKGGKAVPCGKPSADGKGREREYEVAAGESVERKTRGALCVAAGLDISDLDAVRARLADARSARADAVAAHATALSALALAIGSEGLRPSASAHAGSSR